jgi:voltage-gated potassium channel
MPIPFLIGLAVAIRVLWAALRDPVIRDLSLVVIVILCIGMIIFHELEDWGWLDSLYFSVITLATVGFGDFAPTSDAGKIFAIIYIFFGVGFLVAFVTAIAQRSRAWTRAFQRQSKQDSELPSWARH